MKREREKINNMLECDQLPPEAKSENERRQLIQLISEAQTPKAVDGILEMLNQKEGITAGDREKVHAAANEKKAQLPFEKSAETATIYLKLISEAKTPKAVDGILEMFNQKAGITDGDREKILAAANEKKAQLV